jgi:hypothetical protein
MLLSCVAALTGIAGTACERPTHAAGIFCEPSEDQVSLMWKSTRRPIPHFFTRFAMVTVSAMPHQFCPGE